MKKAEFTSRAREATSWKPPTVRIVGPLRSRINALAHHLALMEESRLRAAMTGRVQAAADTGASLNDLHALIDAMGVGGA